MLKKMKYAPVRVIPNPIKFPYELPVCERREEIREAISQHQVVIIAGETGSGKTTQIPKICLELGRGQEARIGHTQPRRLAARRRDTSDTRPPWPPARSERRQEHARGSPRQLAPPPPAAQHSTP